MEVTITPIIPYDQIQSFLQLLLGFINTFLSWEAFGPLGKLSFNVYLVHYEIFPLIFAQFLYPVVITHLTVVMYYYIT